MGSGSSRRLLPGQVLNSTYTIDRFMGSGAYGDVYLVTHRFLGRQALKLLKMDPLIPESVDLLAEARVLIDLVHPNIVRVYDANEAIIEADRVAYITMEYLPGGTLGGLRSSVTRLSPRAAVSVVKQLLAALSYSHGLAPPLLHRDITPNNVLISSGLPNVGVKLADFGLAARVHPDTRILRAAGTIHYLPPEAAWGFASEKSDLYAAALLLYELLTGASAYPSRAMPRESSAVEIRESLLASKKMPPPPPSRFRLDLDSRLDAILLKALAPAAVDRFATAGEFSAALSDLELT